jgi:hypothetical protein
VNTLNNFPDICIIRDTVYLNVSGDDENDCSEEFPCLTFSHTLSLFRNPLIYILECEYNSGVANVNDFDVIISARFVNDIADNVIISQNLSNNDGEGIFIIDTGNLSINNVRFLHNDDSKGIFISITGTRGSLELKSCIIYGSISDLTVFASGYSFIMLSVNETNNDGIIILDNVTFSNISFENKSCIECKGSGFIYIFNSTFDFISSTGSGSCINVSNITVLNIISCEFNNVTSSGDGGSIYFGEGSFSFTVNLTNFSSCCSTNGNGGAIAYASRIGNYLKLHGDVFNRNRAGSGKKGNDYCDVSSDNSSLVLYSCSSITSIITNSLNYKIYHISADRSFDIFLTSLCNSNYNIYYVSIDNGNDIGTCGSLLLYCKTFEYTMNNLSTYPKGIIINTGEYYFSNVSLNSKTLLVAGMVYDYNGDFGMDDIDSYPSIIANIMTKTSNSAIFHFIYSNGIFEYLKLLFSPNSHKENYFFFCFYYYYFIIFILFFFYFIFFLFFYFIFFFFFFIFFFFILFYLFVI